MLVVKKNQMKVVTGTREPDSVVGEQENKSEPGGLPNFWQNSSKEEGEPLPEKRGKFRKEDAHQMPWRKLHRKISLGHINGMHRSYQRV